jgi:PKD domain-containing protein
VPLWHRGRGVAGRAAAAALLSVLALLGAGTASAVAGPGVVMKSQSGEQQPVPGSSIAANADSGGTYTVREQSGDEPRTVSLRGLSIRGLLALAGFNPGAVTHVSVVGGDGPLITLTGQEINNPTSSEGPALVADVGGETRFVKPARSAGGASNYVRSVPGTPLEIQVDGGGLLAVEATASPTSVKTNQTIRFKARVRFAPPGASFTYTWNFDDGTAGSGQQTSHKYTSGGDFEVLVQVRGVGGSQCTPSCGGPGKVRVQVSGQTRRPQDAQGTPLGGGPGGTGTGGTGTGAGSGNGSGGSGSAGTSKGSRKPPPLRAERPEPHSRFSSNPQAGAGSTIVEGILLAGQGSAVEGALPGGSPAGSPKPREGVPGRVENPSNLAASILLALAVVLLGALRERQHVRLRVA